MTTRHGPFANAAYPGRPAPRPWSTRRQFEKAERCLQRALAIDEALYGPDNPSLLSDTNRLGDLYSQWGKFDKAEPYYRRMLALQEKQTGYNSRELCPTLQLLANVLTNLGRVAEAQQLRKRSEALLIAASQKSP